MKDNKLVSIIIAVYNSAKYIEETLESVIGQDWPDKEIIIVDDCSTDNSYELVSRYKSDSVHIYKLEKNSGQSVASNFGYSKSNGQYIKYIDADDLIDPAYLSTMMAAVTTDDALYFSHGVNFHRNYSEGIQKPYLIEDWIEMQPVDFIISPGGIMRQGGRWLIPREIIERGGGWNEQLSLILDYEYFARLSLAAAKIIYVPQAVLYYRQVEHSVSSRKDLKSFHSAFSAIRLTGAQLLEREDSARVRDYISNSFQELLYNIYPRFPRLKRSIREQIKITGGKVQPPQMGGVTLMMSRFLGWKAVFIIRHFAYTLKRSLGLKAL